MDTLPDFDIGDDMLDLGLMDVAVPNIDKMSNPEEASRSHARPGGPSSHQRDPVGKPPIHSIKADTAKPSSNTKAAALRAPEAEDLYPEHYRKRDNVKGNNAKTPDPTSNHLRGESVGGNFGAFRTAQQQLILDRQRSGSKGKRGNARGWEDGEGITSNSYGAAGRTLGTRPGPATGFKPPVRQVAKAFRVMEIINCDPCNV